MIGSALVTIASSVTSLYPLRAAQQEVLPYATYEVLTGTPHGQMVGIPTIRETDVEIICFAHTYDEADTMAESLITLFDRYSGTVGDVVIRDIRHQTGPDDLFEDEGDIYGRSFIIKVWNENILTT